MTLISDFSRMFRRELATLRDELLAYADERDIWALPPGAPNSAGTLALHLTGNLRWYIGAQLGATGYVRDREAEFARRNVPRAELIAQIEAAADEVTRTFASLDPATLETVFPLEVGGLRLNTRRFLLHMEGHLGYHLGQVDFHRRLVTKNAAPVGAFALPPLAER